jgi:outer membrane protein assembly factor BamB
MTGKRVWARNLGVPDNHYGHASSLIVWKNHLLVQYDSNKGGKLLSLDTATGNTQWETVRQTGISWASPILAEIGGNTQVILSAEPLVAGYNPETGEELWSVDCMMGEVGPSPAFGEGLVYAANEYARLVAIKPGAADPIVWENDEYLPEIASPVVAGGLIFIATSYGVLVCYDAATGEKYWEEEAQQGFSASPMVADSKLFAMDSGGIMHIFSLSKEKKKLGTPALGEQAYASPAFSDGTIYLRGVKYLYCIGNE